MRSMHGLRLSSALAFLVLLSGTGRLAAAESRSEAALQFGPHDVKVDFRNRIPGRLDNPVIGPDGSRLNDGNYVAQLYLVDSLLSPGTGVPIGQPARMGTGADAGYWTSPADPVITLPVTVGCCGNFQVRIWDLRAGVTWDKAASGRRALSPVFFFFADNQVHALDDLGYLTLQDYQAPALVVRQGSLPLVREPGPTPGAGTVPLATPGFVGQLYATTNVYGFDFWFGGGGFPLGPVAPVLSSGPRQGFWAVPETNLIHVPNVTPATYFEEPGHVYQVQLRVWDSAAGATWEEALRNRGRTGFAMGEAPSLVSGNRFTAFDASRSGPNLVTFTSLLEIRAPRLPVIAPPGLSLLANPAAGASVFNFGLEQVLPGAPEGMSLYLFESGSQSYLIAQYFGSWMGDNLADFAGGRGFIAYNPGTQPVTLLFSGTYGALPALTRPAAGARFEARGNTLGRAAGFAELTGLTALEGDAVFRMINGRWEINEFTFGAWSLGEPRVEQDGAVFLRLQPPAGTGEAP